ncbi:GIY-YIG nuclease family protein [Altererythrobacter marinus]|uniref:GIY-YIG nuclease family protein n=1 Tax=Pelagerythrobacter marinus TaxID=538382 RepID=A0ABW9V1P1_9SPHN|nr:GIY-YIG nuclease family protein [Pelagerythrobacter marinus]MXO70002.1 GIY-YIG nuclease family protein [Pelagerythrobacter marinus]
MAKHSSVSTNKPPIDTADLRAKLTELLNTPFLNVLTQEEMPIGNFQWGVYAFYDYDGEPIYVGQTNEKVRTRIRRHLTNQRTDAVAMSVLDPFEVYEIEVYPLPQFEGRKAKDKEAKAALDGLERAVYESAIAKSKFGAILNEKNPPEVASSIALEDIPSFRGCIVSSRVFELRNHPDFRIARRALIISRLAQVISERKVQNGLRRVLLTQAKRLAWLSEQRFIAMGGEVAVPEEAND